MLEGGPQAAVVVSRRSPRPPSCCGTRFLTDRGTTIFLATTWPKSLNAIGPIANGQKTLSAVGTDLGPGHMAGDGPNDAYTYGAVLYDYAVDNQIYVIYVVGRRGDRAVVVGGSSNGSC